METESKQPHSKASLQPRYHSKAGYGARRGRQILEQQKEIEQELVTDAWNYFPHEILGGISPAEKLLEHKTN